MTPTELRALIASEQLASLASANAENGWPCTNDQLIADAVELADLLLAKLNQSTPAPAPVVTDPTDWQDAATGLPELHKTCWVVAWDASMGCVLAARPVLWTQSGWQDSNGNNWHLGGSAISVYWRPLYHLPDPDAARVSFIDFIESVPESDAYYDPTPDYDFEPACDSEFDYLDPHTSSPTL